MPKTPKNGRMSRSNYPSLSTGTIGALGELRAAADLLSRGYEVFRAVSPACGCDLIASKDGKLIRVEVRTARYEHKGNISFSRRDNGKFDHYAAVLPDRVTYIPELSN